MIISKEVKVKSSKYYKDLQYDITDKYIMVDIKHLPLGSHSIILVQCDYCNFTRTISYKDYNKNISKGSKFSCSIKCGSIKAKESNLIKYGVDSVNKLESIRLKTKNTTIEKYGVDHISKVTKIRDIKSEKMKEHSSLISERLKVFYLKLSDDDKNLINDKRTKTNLERYGVDNISKLDFIKEKIKSTCFDKYNGFTYQSEDLMNKVKSTNLERYGFEIASKNEEIKNKTILTNLEKWGFKYPSMSDVVKGKIKDTFLEKYNVVNIMYSEEFRKKFNISNELNYVKYIGNRNYEFTCNDCNSKYDIDYDNYYKRRLRNVNTCTNCFPILENSSIKEIELRNYIKSIYTGNIVSSYRDGLEIDIFLPDLKIGFEFNGIYWHNDEKLHKNYHLNKLNHFKGKNIRIINIWEDDWDYKKEIVKSQIDNILSFSKCKLYARKCIVKQVDRNIVKKFLEENHIQGYIRSSIKIGLFYEDELVSIMTFDNSEGRKKMNINEFNLSRFCSKKEYNVVGSASKLLKYFIDKYKPKRVISFADLDWSLGNLYYKLGFNLVMTLKPDFKYIVDHKRINKQRFTKEKLVKLGYDSNLTADKIVENLGISKIYSCGQLKFELLLN